MNSKLQKNNRNICFNDTPATPVEHNNAFEVDRATDMLRRHKLPATDQIPSQLIKAGRRTIGSEIHELMNYILNKE